MTQKTKDIKKDLLAKVDKMLKDMGEDKRIVWIETFHHNIVIEAEKIRKQGNIGKIYQDGIEEQLAEKKSAVKNDGYWVQSYYGIIPELVKQTIEKLNNEKLDGKKNHKKTRKETEKVSQKNHEKTD
jgi:hypothetical protein